MCIVEEKEEVAAWKRDSLLSPVSPKRHEEAFHW